MFQEPPRDPEHALGTVNPSRSSCELCDTCRCWQAMDDMQLILQRLQLGIGDEIVELRGKVAVQHKRRLTLQSARDAIRQADAWPSDTLIVAREADARALSFLRAEHRSYYVEETGEVYIAAEADFGPPSSKAAEDTRNPFATRASRIARLLLLQPGREFTVQQLGRLARVDKSLASRAVSTLASQGYVDVTPGTEDERYRFVRIASAVRLLNDWSDARRHRSSRVSEPQRFDIGTRSVSDTLRAIADAAEPGLQYAISGLAGAAAVKRAVEPADVLLLTTREGRTRWSELLLARRTRGDRGLLQIALIDDEFLFRLAEPRHDLLIADPVQLWLDTSAGGERAQEASFAIAKEMGW